MVWTRARRAEKGRRNDKATEEGRKKDRKRKWEWRGREEEKTVREMAPCYNKNFINANTTYGNNLYRT